MHIYRTCIPSSKVMQWSVGQSLTRWAGLLLLPITTENTYSVQGWRPLITYMLTVTLERVLPTSLWPEAVFHKTVTTCPLVREVYIGKWKTFKLSPVCCQYQRGWNQYYSAKLVTHLPHNSQTRWTDGLTHSTNKICFNWGIHNIIVLLYVVITYFHLTHAH